VLWDMGPTTLTVSMVSWLVPISLTMPAALSCGHVCAVTGPTDERHDRPRK
jgi:hypothetical protein